MKSPWKAFLGESALLFALALACTYVAHIWITDKNALHPDPAAIYVSMNIGALLASVIAGLIGALCFWRLNPLLLAVAVCSGLVSGNPVIAIVAPVFASLIYVATTRLRMRAGFYLPDKSTGSDG